MGVVVSAGDRVAVELVGPRVGAAAVSGEVADGVAELFVGGPAEADAAVFAGLAGGGCDAGEAGEGFWGGEAGAAVTDLGEEPGGADGARAGQAGEDVLVGVQVELLADLLGQGADLLDEAGQDGEQRTGGVGGAGWAGQTAGRGGQPGGQDGGVDPAAVAAFRSQPARRLALSQSSLSWVSNRPTNFRLIVGGPPRLAS